MTPWRLWNMFLRVKGTVHEGRNVEKQRAEKLSFLLELAFSQLPRAFAWTTAAGTER